MFTFLGKAKAALMGLVTLGEMRALLVNNGLTTESGKYFLDAAYGKTLADLIAANATSITKLNSDKVQMVKNISEFLSLEELYEAGQNNNVRIGFYQWNTANRPSDDNGIVFIGNWYVSAFSLTKNKSYVLQNNYTWSERT